jgi:hypothetical protein
MQDFVVHYRARAVPRLRRSARFLAILVTTHDREFHWAVAEVQGEAIRLGAKFLPERLYRRLMEQAIPGWLLAGIERVQPEWDAAKARATAAAIDIRRALERVPS